ncbi:MAG: hypothetical protein AB7U75_18290 [Hyphomicrobiaceae bacterium]
MRMPSLVIAATIALASATFTTSVEAGRCGSGFRGFGHGHVFSHRFNSSSSSYYARKRARALAAAQLAQQKRTAAARLKAERELVSRRRLAAAAKAAEAKRKLQDVAEIDPPVPVRKPETTLALAATGIEDVAPAGKEITCKRYIPSAGLTISVPCE